MNSKNIFRTEVDTSLSINNLSHSDRFILIGSCFSNQMSKYFNRSCFNVLNPFGTIYNPISLQQNIFSAINNRIFDETNLIQSDEVFLSWNHSGRYFNKHEKLLLKTINNEQEKIHELISSNATIIVTFGTANVYELISSNKIVANCHKKSSSSFKKRILSVSEIVSSWTEVLKSINNRIIFTVSPVRHIRDGLKENNLSKSTLLLAVNELCKEFGNQTHYFPSYELLIDELRDYRFYANDWVHPSEEATDFIWEKLSNEIFSTETKSLINKIGKIRRDLAHKPKYGISKEHTIFLKNVLEKINRIKNFTINYDWNPEINQIKSMILKSY